MAEAAAAAVEVAAAEVAAAAALAVAGATCCSQQGKHQNRIEHSQALRRRGAHPLGKKPRSSQEASRPRIQIRNDECVL